MKTKKGPARNKQQQKIVCKFVETKTYDQRETIGIVWFTSFKGCCSLLHSKNNQRKANGVHCIKISERLCVVWLMIFDMFWQKKYVGIVTVAARWVGCCLNVDCCSLCQVKAGVFSFWLRWWFFRGSFIFADPITFFLLPIFLSGVDHFLHYFMLNFPITSAWCVSILCKVQHRSAPFWKW